MTTADGEIFMRRAPVGVVPAKAAPTEMQIGDLYRAVAQRSRLLIPSLALTFALAALYIFLTPPRYAATMSLLVDTRERPPIGVDAQPIAQNPDVALIEAQMRLLTSNEVLRRTVDNEKLRFDPEFAPAKPSAAMAAIKSLFGAAPQTDIAADQIAETLAKAITTKRSEKSYVIDVEVRASSAEKAERLTRALANAYFQTQAKLGDDIVDKETAWLDKKIADLRTRVDEAERRVEDFRKSKSIIVSDGHTLPEQQLKDANTALIAARGKLAAQEAKYAQLQAAIRGGGSIETLNETIHSPLIEKLRGDYATLSRDAAYTQSTLGPRHPSYVTVKAQIEALRGQITQEMGRIAAAERHELQAARSAEKASEQLLADLQKSMDSFGGPRLELAELERQAAAVRERYEKALAARENVHREVVSSPNGVLIDQPQAVKGRVSPKTLQALIIAAAAGLNIWIASALILEFLARKRAATPFSADDVEPPPTQGKKLEGDDAIVARSAAPLADAASVVPSLEVSLPTFELKRRRDGGRFRGGDAATRARAHEVMETPGDSYRGAIAKLYDALWERSSLRGGARIVAITGPEKGAGVSTAALSLALFACEQGDRVLLLDGDERRSTLAAPLYRLAPAKQHFGFDDPPCVYRRDPEGAGEILLGLLEDNSFGLPEELRSKAKLDLIILDCGVCASAGSLAALQEKVDAVIAIERDVRAGQRQASMSFGAKEPAGVGATSGRAAAE